MPKGQPEKTCLYARKFRSEPITAVGFQKKCKPIRRDKLHCLQDRPTEINRVYDSGGLARSMGMMERKGYGMVVVGV
jgi:hypothetical protein